MSIHWTPEQATVSPVVVLRKVNSCVGENHFVFINDVLKHDVPFVEICNNIFHKYYADINMPVLIDIEFNDGCSSQFKSIAAFTQYACHSVPTTRIFFETSHWKSKPDGLGRVKKGLATHKVNAREVNCNAFQIFEFWLEKLTIKDSPHDKKTLLKSILFHS